MPERYNAFGFFLLAVVIVFVVAAMLLDSRPYPQANQPPATPDAQLN